jgi:hypothetical protein
MVDGKNTGSEKANSVNPSFANHAEYRYSFHSENRQFRKEPPP